MTIVEMLEKNAKFFPTKTAIIYKELKISWKEFYEQSNALANFLISIGIKKGERVGLLLEKTPEAVVSFLGVATAGGVVFPIDYNHTFDNIQSILDLSRPSVLIVSANYQPLLSKMRLPCLEKKIIIIGKKERKQYHTWEEVYAQKAFNSPDVSLQENDIVYLNYTSGTTGIPKGAITTHANIYWNTLSAAESLKLTHDDVHLCMFPVFGHPHELFARALLLGGTIVLIDGISPKTITKAISDYNVTCMMAIAPIYKTLVRLYESEPFSITSLRLPESGGMHVSATLVKQFKERFKIPFIPVWGSTETSGVALVTPVNGEYKPGSMGKICPWYEAKIVDEKGNEMPSNKNGEMTIKGPAVCSGYFGNPEETAKQMKDRWFFTGDIVKKDSEGYFYFVGRKTGMMKVAGLKVFPIEIEDVLITHSKIDEVAVVSTQDGLHGEVPKAVIVPKKNLEINKKEIRTYCEERISKYKVPRIIEFRSKLPKTPGGKILYRKL